MSINAAGVALIKEFENCKLVAYLDKLADPPVWTVGWGQTGPDIQEGTIWTQAKADAVFLQTTAEFERAVLAECVVEPNENQLAAMVSLAYNIGMGWTGAKKPRRTRDGFRQSTVLRRHNAGDFVGAAAAFALWNKAGGQVRAGLTRRRAAEAALYLTPVDERTQTTRAAAETDKAPANVAGWVAGASGALTVAQQTIAQVEDVWGKLYGLGINPHLLLGALGLATVAAVAWFAYRQWKERN